MSADAPTPYELIASLRDDLRGDMRHGFSSINTRLDRMVTAEMFELHRRALDERHQTQVTEIAALKAAREKDKDDRATDRRWRVGLTITSATAIVLFFVSVVVDLSRAAS